MGTAVQGCPEPPDPCKDLLQQILEFVANLKKRYGELRKNEGELPQTKPSTPDPRYGYRSIEGEQHQYKGRRNGLRNRLADFKKNGCGDPPAEATEWADKPIPSPDPKPENNSNLRTAVVATAATGATISAGYLLYRGVRMIPSLLPPLWWTIPENLALP